MEPIENLLDRAVRHHDSGELDQAAPLYQRVLRVDPSHAGALYRLGTLELARSNIAAGAELLKQAAQRSPGVADIQNSLGIACKALGQWGSAAEAFERALQANPTCSTAYFHLGDLSQTLGQIDRAIDFYLQTIKLDGQDEDAFARLGGLLFSRENWVGAEQCYRRLLDLLGVVPSSGVGTTVEPSRLPRVLQYLNQLGLACLRQEQLDDAAGAFLRVLALDPSIAEMHSNLAYVYERQGRLAQAVTEGQQAVALRPQYAEGHNNLGVAYRAQHRLEEARSAFEKAVALKPDFALARFNLGTIDLMRGDFRRGWQGYEWRLLTLATPPRKFSIPRWTGSPMAGRTLLVHCEQGYGDSLQFARLILPARERSGATILVESPPALVPLFDTIAGGDAVIAAGTTLPAHDAEISLPSLPGVLSLDQGMLPVASGYVTVPAAYRERWQPRMAQMTQALEEKSSQTRQAGAGARRLLRVGIAWKGNPAQAQDVIRSCPLAVFAKLARVPGVAWFSLQKEALPDELGSDWPVESAIACLGPDLADFADTAAVIEQLDLVITIDSAVAHLAGALGHDCWTLLCHTPDWRWQLERRDSPWYPAMRLFRQQRWGDWPAVIEEVAGELSRRVETL